MQHLSKTSSCAENVHFSKRKEQNRTTETAWPRIPSDIHCSQRFFSTVAARKAAPSYLYPQSYCLSSPTKQKFKKCSTTRKGPHLPRKFSFPKKKKRKKKRNLTTSTSHSFSHCQRCSLRFFLPLQREKLPFGPLLASRRFSLQYPWNMQRFAYKSQILQPWDPGLSRWKKFPWPTRNQWGRETFPCTSATYAYLLFAVFLALVDIQLHDFQGGGGGGG